MKNPSTLELTYLHEHKIKHNFHELSSPIHDYNRDAEMTLYILLYCLTLRNVRKVLYKHKQKHWAL